MFAEIITIGDEILIGQVVDTNSAFIGEELTKIGIEVIRITTISDDRDSILAALDEAGSRARLVIITGGLGPTKDDVTKKTLSEFLDDPLVRNPGVLHHIEELFRRHITNTPISEINRDQALVPSKATVLHNENGTAPGIWATQKGTVYVSLPGVPFEMRALMHNEVLPRVVKQFDRSYIVHRTLVTYGLGESALAERIASWEDALPSNMKLAYLPNLGMVRLRLTAKGKDKEQVDAVMEAQLEVLRPMISDILVGQDDGETLEVVLGKLLAPRKLTLATAESCTGGRIAAQLTSVPGASAYFKGGVVSYATQTKVDVLGVDRGLIDQFSVVSREVAAAMAQNVRDLLGSDFAVATTGNAGPAKGDSEAPIGTVWIAVATPNRTVTEVFRLGSHRERIVQKAVHKAMEILRREIMKF